MEREKKTNENKKIFFLNRQNERRGFLNYENKKKYKFDYDYDISMSYLDMLKRMINLKS